MKRLVVSDPGIDDIVALALLAARPDATDVCLSATFGNTPQSFTARNAKEFIAVSKAPWSYLDGAALPDSGAVERPWPDYFHGPDGVWNVHALSEPIEGVRAGSDGAYDRVMSLGPMTDFRNRVRSGFSGVATIMGGVFREPGNETDFAETNIAFDPDAAHDFFANRNEMTARVVPLDVTRKVTWSRPLIESVDPKTALQAWVKEMLLAWYAKYDHAREEEFCLHDPLAVYLDLHPEKATWWTTGVDVVLEGEERGRTIESDSHLPCEVAMDLDDAEQIESDIFEAVFHESF